MPGTPTDYYRKPSGASNIGSPKMKSFTALSSPGKGAQTKGYLGMTPSKMGSSKIMAALPEMKTDKMATTKAAIQVFDANGVDVTPRPLYRPDPHTGTPKPSKLLTSQEGSFSSEFVPSHSLYQNTLNPSMLGQFSRVTNSKENNQKNYNQRRTKEDYRHTTHRDRNNDIV